MLLVFAVLEIVIARPTEAEAPLTALTRGVAFSPIDDVVPIATTHGIAIPPASEIRIVSVSAHHFVVAALAEGLVIAVIAGDVIVVPAA